jgi:hypothetical protein
MTAILLGVLMFTSIRSTMLFHYSAQNLWLSLAVDVRHCYYIGFLFDIKTLTILFAPFYLFGLLLMLLPYYYGMKRYLIVLCYISMALLLLCLLVSLVNFYYYDAFQAHFNLFFFGVTDGETGSVLASVWQEYPVVKVLIIVVLAAVALFYISKKLINLSSDWAWSPHWIVKWVLAIVVIVLYFLGARGSVSVFPLQERQTYFSTNNLLNQSSINGVAALAYAYRDKKK